MNEKLRILSGTDEFRRVRSFVIERGLIPPSSRVLAALSGGADSVFALSVLKILSEELCLHVEAFHMNHCIRGEEAERDADFSRKFCEETGVPFTLVKRDVPLISKEKGISEESAGRQERYAYMYSVRDRFDRAVTAHHMDDSAESMLMHLIRGSGVRGLSGIPEEADGYIVRPLLCLERAEIERALGEAGIGYVTDSTNASGDYFRNRVRNTVLPVLKAENPSVTKALMRLSEVSRAYVGAAEEMAEKVGLIKKGERLVCRREDAASLPEAPRYELILRAARQLGKGSDLGYEAVKKASELFDGPAGRQYHLHGLLVECLGEFVSFSPLSGRPIKTSPEPYCFPVSPGDEVVLPDGGRVRVSLVKKMEKPLGDMAVTFIDYDKIQDTVFIRSFRPSDVIRPVGSPGRKPVRRFFTDRKVPADERGRIPVLSDGDRPAAVIGMAADEAYKVDGDSVRILMTEYLSSEGDKSAQ